MTIQLQEPLAANHLADAVLSAMASHPDGRIVGTPKVLTHEKACSLAHRIARDLTEISFRPVAICTRKSPETIAAVMGILKSGRAYTPLDPSHPSARLEAILERLAPSALIVDAHTREKLQPLAAAIEIPLLVLEDLGSDRKADPIAAEHGLAAVLHTSGSTGIPKQVLIGASAIEVFTHWVQTEFQLTARDCLLSHAPLAFDLSFLDIFAGLSVGATIALADTDEARNGDKLAHIIDTQQVTFVHATPSALSLLTQTAKGKVFPKVRAVLFAGEPMYPALLNDLMAAFPNAQLTNIYGCTETNDTFFYRVPRAGAPDPLPLGIPLPYVEYRLLDQDGLPVGPCEDGTLWVTCPTMMNGYSDDALTRRVFAEFDGATYYNTNDRARLGDDGLLRFLGRADTVKKINGYRIDLAEIEACFAKAAGVAEVAVFEKNSPNGRHLAAAVSSADPQLTSLLMRIHAMKFLPSYAIPKQITLTTNPLPKNSNGKICRKTLEELNQ